MGKVARRPGQERAEENTPRARKKGSGWERPVQRARNGPQMNEDPVGPRHRVAGGPVGYKHWMRDGMGARG